MYWFIYSSCIIKSNDKTVVTKPRVAISKKNIKTFREPSIFNHSTRSLV